MRFTHSQRSRFAAREMRRIVWQLATDDGGQDLVEYALLGALIGVSAALVWQQLADTVGIVYGDAEAGVQDISGCTPDPGGGGC